MLLSSIVAPAVDQADALRVARAAPRLQTERAEHVVVDVARGQPVGGAVPVDPARLMPRLAPQVGDGLADELGHGVVNFFTRPCSITGTVERAVTRAVLMAAMRRYFRAASGELSETAS